MQAVGVLQANVAVEHPKVGTRGRTMEWPLQVERQRQPSKGDENSFLRGVAVAGISHGCVVILMAAADTEKGVAAGEGRFPLHCLPELS